MRHKAISLMSGGLDSVLATILISQQDIDVLAIKFLTPFGCDLEDSSCGFDASHVAKRFGFSFKICPMGEEYVKMVKNPEYGWGKNMNPCIDCRIMMLNWAKEVMANTGAEFLITGEVLNQRPMSQTRNKLDEVEKKTGLEGKLLRPLSARLLRETDPEKEGYVDRSKLMSIEGRSRSVQLELARKFGLTRDDYGQPAGGCLLTDPSFSNRLRDYWKYSESTCINDIELLKIGRHFRYSADTKIIVGRNKLENDLLAGHLREGITIIEFDVPAPTVLIQGTINEEIKSAAIQIGMKYTKNHPHTVVIRDVHSERNEQIDGFLEQVELLHIT